MTNETKTLISALTKLLNGGGAHVGFKQALEGLPEHLRGKVAYNLPYSIWQLVEHIRIAQWDMLEFSRDSNHQSPKWPDAYWPKEKSPPDEASWDNSINQIYGDLQEFISLLSDRNLYVPFSYGEGQSLLIEALQMADHAAYHIAEIVVIRRLLNAWK